MLNICLQSCSSMFLHSLRAACFLPCGCLCSSFTGGKREGAFTRLTVQPFCLKITAASSNTLTLTGAFATTWLSALDRGFIQSWKKWGRCCSHLVGGCSFCQQDQAVPEHIYGAEVGIIPPSPDLPAHSNAPLLKFCQILWNQQLKDDAIHYSGSVWLQRSRILFTQA